MAPTFYFKDFQEQIIFSCNWKSFNNKIVLESVIRKAGHLYLFESILLLNQFSWKNMKIAKRLEVAKIGILREYTIQNVAKNGILREYTVQNVSKRNLKYN